LKKYLSPPIAAACRLAVAASAIVERSGPQ